MIKRLLLLCVIILLVSGCTTTTHQPAAPIISTGSNLSITFIDVGQGDSEYLTFPNGKTLLIDTGTGTTKSNDNIGKAVHNINTLVMTHDHADHTGGFEYVESHYTVGESYTYSRLHTGDYLHIDDTNTTVSILNPSEYLPDAENDRSVVIKVVYHNVSMLFEGDAGSVVEDKFNTGHVDILKVAHHGSRTSTSASFLRKTSPDICIISVGEGNTYGHPTAEALDRIKNVGCKMYRTDIDGSVTIKTDGETYGVE